MKLIYSEKLPKILNNKKKLEKKLNVKITNNGNDVFINGEAPDEYDAEQVIIALNLGFPFSVAISIKEEELMNQFLALNIPIGAINNLSEVFENESAKNLILEEVIDGVNTKRIRTAIFKISD